MRLPRLLLDLLLAGLIVGGPAQAQQFNQQGSQLVGSGAVGDAQQGFSVSISADGNTALVGGWVDNGGIGAAWIFTRNGNGVWTQQAKLVGAGFLGPGAGQGSSVSLSADGNTALVGGFADNFGQGAAWVFTRTNGTWSQQAKLFGTGAEGLFPSEGQAVALSGDGNTAIVGANLDKGGLGAVWIFVRAKGAWSQQGNKLSATDAVGGSYQGWSAGLSYDGNTAVVGGFQDNGAAGAAWIYTRTNSVWSQQGSKLVGSGAVGPAGQGSGVGISADGNTVVVGGGFDNGGVGAAWVFTRTNGVWNQQGGKLVGAGYVGKSGQGAVAISGDGNTVIVGGATDDDDGASWIFRRSHGVWNQFGPKLVGTASGFSLAGSAVAISADGTTAIVGGYLGAGAAWVFVGPAAPPPAPTVPAPVGVSPASGAGTTGTFTFTFSDTGGWQSLNVVDVLIRDVLDGRQACYVAFLPSGANSGSVDLVDNAGEAGGPYAGMLLPGSGSVSNGQCSITAAGSSAAGAGNTLTLTLAITFTPGFAGNKVLYLSAQDSSANSGWQALGTWGVPGATITGPAVSGVTPGHGNTSTQTYTFTFTDTNGWQDITVADVLVNNAISGVGACYVAFAPMGAGSGAVYLVDNAGDAGGPYAGMLLPGSGTVSNGQCSIAAAGSSVSGAGNTLTLMLAITFNHSFAGNQLLYLAARSTTSNSGWQAVGSVAVP